MKKLFISVISLLTIFNYANAQNTFPKSGSVGIATIKPNASAILDIDTTGKGIKPNDINHVSFEKFHK